MEFEEKCMPHSVSFVSDFGEITSVIIHEYRWTRLARSVDILVNIVMDIFSLMKMTAHGNSFRISDPWCGRVTI